MSRLAADQTAALRREGYDFMARRGRLRGRAWFETRLMGRAVVILSGGNAPEQMYEPGRFTRRHALPPTTLRLLQGHGSVNQLDGAEHRHRKTSFLALLGISEARALANDLTRRLTARFAQPGSFVLLKEAEQILCATALAWLGTPAPSAGQLRRRTAEYGAMLAGAGASGPSVIGALLLRARNEAWMRSLVRRVRANQLGPRPESPLAVVSRWRGADGAFLPVRVAAIELINLTRPLVAVARYIAFAAHALHFHPEWGLRIRDGNDAELEAFAQEVRRFYPFFPAVAGIVQTPFEWEGRRFARGEWVLADLHGADRDPARWTEPQMFNPDRFLAHEAGKSTVRPAARPSPIEDEVVPASDDPDPIRPPTPDAASGMIVAQGAGDPRLGHRCPGEGVTLELIKAAARVLATADYRLPAQDFTIDRSRMPTAPAEGIRVSPAVADRPDRETPGALKAVAYGLAAGLGGIAALLFLRPIRTAQAVGLLKKPSGPRPLVQALAFRDLAVSASLVGAATTSSRALRAAAVAAFLVPLLDLAMVRRTGRRGRSPLAPHLISAAALLALAAGAHATARRRNEN